eukprot:762794-Rhodomonas_salina.1
MRPEAGTNARVDQYQVSSSWYSTECSGYLTLVLSGETLVPGEPGGGERVPSRGRDQRQRGFDLRVSGTSLRASYAMSGTQIGCAVLSSVPRMGRCEVGCADRACGARRGSVYFMMATLCTVGYGDIAADGDAER